MRNWLLVLTLVLAACSGSKPLDSVDSLVKQPDRLKEVMRQCRDDRAKLGDAECNAAGEAFRRRFMASAMEAERARRQRRLDAEHDSAARLRRETPLLEFIKLQRGSDARAILYALTATTPLPAMWGNGGNLDEWELLPPRRLTSR